jgi:hypothetical protein
MGLVRQGVEGRKYSTPKATNISVRSSKALHTSSREELRPSRANRHKERGELAMTALLRRWWKAYVVHPTSRFTNFVRTQYARPGVELGVGKETIDRNAEEIREIYERQKVIEIRQRILEIQGVPRGKE